MIRRTQVIALTLSLAIPAAFAQSATDNNQTMQMPNGQTMPANQMQQPATATLPATTTTTTTGTTTSGTTVQPATTETTTTATQATSQMAAVPQSAVIDFSQQAALTAFSYNYKTYQQDMEKMQSYFTKDGWDSFNKALTDSNNLQVVQKEKLTVTSKLNGDAQVLQHDNVATGEQWQIQVPVQVTYVNEQNQQIQQNLMVKMAVTTVSKSENPLGIGIRQFIAMPAPTGTTPAASTTTTTTGTTAPATMQPATQMPEPTPATEPTPQTDTNP